MRQDWQSSLGKASLGSVMLKDGISGEGCWGFSAQHRMPHACFEADVGLVGVGLADSTRDIVPLSTSGPFLFRLDPPRDVVEQRDYRHNILQRLN